MYIGLKALSTVESCWIRLNMPTVPIKMYQTSIAGANVYPTFSVPNLCIEKRTTKIAIDIIAIASD